MNDVGPLAAEVAAVAQIEAVQRILEIVCRTTGLGFSAVARVTDKLWVACAVRDEIAFGLKPGGELELQTTICHEIRSSRLPVAIDHVERDGTYCNHPTPRKYGFQSYISVPIILADGHFFGTLCAIDPKPARINTPEILGMFTLFADLIARHIDAQSRVILSEKALAQAKKIAHLRDQFTAVLGHDLRNPLAAILSATEVLNLLQPSEESMEFIAIIQRSGKRMVELIDNILDFARGEMGDGLSIKPVAEPNLAGTLAQVIGELQLAWPNRKFLKDISLSRTVCCDAPRIAQVLSNLLANALTHGAADEPIWIRAHCTGERFELSVTNLGPTIPPEMVDHLFQPFSRGQSHSGAQGLGLGLYIAAEIARAHAGKLTVTSSEGKTCFTLRIPIS